jgi:hypothetical protein
VTRGEAQIRALVVVWLPLLVWLLVIAALLAMP